MTWLTGHWDQTWVVAVKAVLLYATALAGLRLGTRRTIAQMSMFDFVTAVAMGAIIGRTATASSASYVQGAVAMLTLIIAHRLVSVLRYIPAVARITDYRIRILVSHGRVRRRQLRICGLTDDDLASALRQEGCSGLDGVRLVIYEPGGGITVVPEAGPGGALIDAATAAAAGPPSEGERAPG